MSRGADLDFELSLPYPDLTVGDGTSDETSAGGGDGGSILQRTTETGASSSRKPAEGNRLHRWPALARIVGMSHEQLDFRLSCVARDYLALCTVKSGRPAQFHAGSPDVRLIEDSLLAAAELLVRPRESVSEADLAIAVRLAEHRWRTVRRTATMRAGLRPAPPGRPGRRRRRPRLPSARHDHRNPDVPPPDPALAASRISGQAEPAIAEHHR